MPATNFTARWVQGVKAPPKGQVDHFDNNGIGKGRSFGLRVSYGGEKSWFVMYRFGRRLRRLTLGAYPQLSLKDAREEADKQISKLTNGEDPAAERQEMRKAETFSELADLYIERYAKKHKKSWCRDQQIIKREMLPRWKHHRAREIKRKDVIALLDEIMDRGASIGANRALEVLRRVYNWGISRDIVEINPCAQVKPPGKETKRQRVLKDGEIKKAWKAYDQQGPIMGSIFKLLFLTIQRECEVFSMRWVDLDNGWWTIPPEIAKNGLAHRVPLVPQASEILRTLQPVTGDQEWVFPSPTRKGKHVGNVQKAQQRARDAAKIEDFRVQDIRRTGSSMMTGMGIPRLVVGKILNHVEKGVTATYDRHSYDKEKRDALNRWAIKLKNIVSPVGKMKAA